MTTDENASPRPSRPVWRELTIGISTSLIVSIAGLLIEYKTGLFQTGNSSGQSHLSTVLILLAGFGLFATLTSAIHTIAILSRRVVHVREQFALGAALTIVSSTLLLLPVPLDIMPWSIPRSVASIFWKMPIQHDHARWTEYLLLLALYVSLVQFLGNYHRRWTGAKSVDEYSATQRGERPLLSRQAVDELTRLLRHRPPRRIYEAQDQLQAPSQLEPVQDSTPWRDRARDLVKLSSSSYVIEPEGWRDSVACWIGNNIDNGKLIFVAPLFTPPTTARLKELVAFCQSSAKNQKTAVDSLILALKDGPAPTLQPRSSFPIIFKTESDFLDRLVDFTDYFYEIRRRFERTCLPDSQLTIKDVYVPAHVLESSPNHTTTVEDFLSSWLMEPGYRHLALLGEYGQGKSTTALAWAHQLISQRGEESIQRVPLLIELRGTSPRNLTPLQLLGAWAAQYGINPQALVALAVAGRLIIIFEGFDEMALVGDSEMRLKHFRTLWRFAYPRSKIVITGRPNFFLDDQEMKAALGIGALAGDKPYCYALRLQPFTPTQIEAALRSYNPDVRQQICALVARNNRFRELVSRPSLLHVVAVLWEKEQLANQEDQLTSAFVMSLFVQNSYRRQGLKETDSQEFMALTTAERDYFMAGVAAYMAGQGLPNQISSDQLGIAITLLIRHIPEALSFHSPAITGEAVRPLNVRLSESEHGADHVATDVRTCGLLADDPAAPGTFRFGHKSFLEFLFADVLAERITKPQSERAGAILTATGATLMDIGLYPVSVGFLAELLVGSESGVDATEFERATLLLHRLLSVQTGWQNRFARIRIFWTALLQLSMHSRKTRVRVSTMAMLSLPPILTVFLFQSHLPARGRHSEYFFLFAFLSCVLLCLLILSANIMLGHSSARRSASRLDLWVHVCHSLGIKDSLLHEIVGTCRVPWLRSEPWSSRFSDPLLDAEGRKDLDHHAGLSSM